MERTIQGWKPSPSAELALRRLGMPYGRPIDPKQEISGAFEMHSCEHYSVVPVQSSGVSIGDGG
jgi:hypothetical protein